MAKIKTRVTLRTPQAAALIKAASNEAMTDMGLQALQDVSKHVPHYKQLKISVGDTELELGDIVGGRERITGISMASPVVRKDLTVTGKGRVTMEYKLKGED